ncbi:hypothetical protein BDR06DRAFT_1015696, partial [Suillus hirtellus]
MEIDGVDPYDWKDWNGPQYWARIGSIHGWSTGDVSHVTVISKDWAQNGVDCGPIACSVLEQCLSSGLDAHGDLPVLKVQCGHILRIKMLSVIAGRIRLSCSDFLMLLDNPHNDWRHDDVPDEDVINSIQHGHHQAECLTFLNRLRVVSATCSSCQHSLHHKDMRQPSHNGNDEDEAKSNQHDLEDYSNDGDDPIGMDLPAERKENLTKLLKASKQLTGSRNRNNIPRRAIGKHIEVDLDMPLTICGTVDSQRSVSASASRRQVKDWNLGSNKRFPRHIAPPPLAAYSGRRWLQDQQTFDDYENGPTIEMLLMPRDINPITTFQAGGIQLSTLWVDWVDHGYRIMPSSFHIFYQCNPIATMDHIMPIGTTDSYDASSQIPDRVTGAYSLARLGPSQEAQHTHVTDVEILSASELIESAQYDPPLHEE